MHLVFHYCPSFSLCVAIFTDFIFHKFSLFALICSYLRSYFLSCQFLLCCSWLFLICILVFLICPHFSLFVTICALFPPYLSLFFTICSLCVLILPLIKFGRLKSVLWARRCLRNVLCKGLCTYVDFQKRILHWTVVWLGFGSSIHENELNLKIVVSNRS